MTDHIAIDGCFQVRHETLESRREGMLEIEQTARVFMREDPAITKRRNELLAELELLNRRQHP